MIISRSPLRVSIGGGGTDLPSYFTTNGGTTFSSLAINKYIYVSINERFINTLFLRYSKNEEIDDLKKIEHPIIRETLIALKAESMNLEITSTSDVPSGTGLGSSGSFGVALQLALRSHLGLDSDKKSLALNSTNIEMNILGRPIGLQDQYISAYGGLTEFKVDEFSNVSVQKIDLNTDLSNLITDNMLLFYADSSRDASTVLNNEKKIMQSKSNTKQYENIVELGKEMYESLVSLDLENYGKIMHEYWLLKRERQKDFTLNSINEVYDYVFNKKLIFGGKLVGAGGSGFLLFCSTKPEELREQMSRFGMAELKFSPDVDGAKLLEC